MNYSVRYVPRTLLNVASGVFVALTVVGCGSAVPPGNTADACAIFAEKPRWYRSALKAERKWQVPISVMLAVIKRESSFVHNARPPRTRGLFNMPGKRQSSAYGYPQAKDETWRDYKQQTRNWRGVRTDFADAIDFVGWYLDRAARHLGLSRRNGAHLYAAYHEGLSGYKTGRWRGTEWLVGTMGEVARQANFFEAQLVSCRSGPARKYRRKSSIR